MIRRNVCLWNISTGLLTFTLWHRGRELSSNMLWRASFNRFSKKSKRFTTQMQSLSWSTVVTICTTWFNIPRLRIFPTQFICMSLGILKQRMDLFLKIQRLALVLEMECLLWGTNWVFIYYVEEIRVSKTINWKTLRMVTQIKIDWGTRPEDLTLHSFMSLDVSVC